MIDGVRLRNKKNSWFQDSLFSRQASFSRSLPVVTGEGDIPCERNNLSRHNTDPTNVSSPPRSAEFNFVKSSLAEDHGRRTMSRNSLSPTEVAAEASVPPKDQTKRIKQQLLANATLRSIQHGVGLAGTNGLC